MVVANLWRRARRACVLSVLSEGPAVAALAVVLLHPLFNTAVTLVGGAGVVLGAKRPEKGWKGVWPPRRSLVSAAPAPVHYSTVKCSFNASAQFVLSFLFLHLSRGRPGTLPFVAGPGAQAQSQKMLALRWTSARPRLFELDPGRHR